MRDNFKKYIERNATAFEDSFDLDKGLKDFKQRQNHGRRPKRYLMIAASISLVVAMTSFFYFGNRSTNEISEWAEVEHFYEQQIDDMTKLVMNLSEDDEILSDLDQLDLAFAELKQDLKDDAANQEVIEAMMNHYRLKLSILEKMLEEIKESNEDENIS